MENWNGIRVSGGPDDYGLSIDLEGQILGGALCDELFRLPGLTELVLSGCKLSGPIPESIGEATRLASLNLGNNDFTGQLPSSLGKLANLLQLDVSGNPKLAGLFCNENQIASLDLSANPALTTLHCFSNRLTELDQRLDELESQRREVSEALFAGEGAEQALAAVLDSLDRAGDWGTWDMLGGGMLATMAKHGHLDDAQAGIGWAQQCLSRFRTELADVQHMEIPQVYIGEFATFADYFFDGLFADWFVQSRIHDAQDGVSGVHLHVLHALGRLRELDAALAGEQAGLEGERDRLLQGAGG